MTLKDLRSTVRNNLFWLSLKLVLNSVLGLLITTILVRNLTIPEFGIYTMLVAVLGYLNMLTSFGINSVFQRYLPELYQKEDYFNFDKVVLRGLLAEFAAVSFAVGLIALFAEPIGTLLKTSEWVAHFSLFSPYYVFMLEGWLLAIVLSSLFLQKHLTFAEVSTSFMRVCAISAALFLGFSLKGVLAAEVSAAVFYTALLLGVYLVKFRRTHPVGVKTGTLSFRRLFRYGGFTFVNEIGSSILNESTDYFIIAAFLGPAAVGLYAFATRILKMFTHALPTNIFQRLVHPVFFLRFAENKDYGELSRMFNLLAKFNAFLCIPFCVGVFTLGDKMIVHLFDEKYLESFTAMRIIVLFVAVNTLFTSVGLVIKSIERVEVLLKSKVFSLYNLAGDILVAPAYGITGVAVVTGSAVLFKELYCFYYARKYTGLAIDWRGVAAILANSLLMGALVYPMRALVTGLATFAAAVVAGVCVYGLLSRLNRPFTRDERGTINSLLPAPLFPF